MENNNTYIVEIRNKLSLGDEMEVLLPGSVECLNFKIEKLYDIKTNNEIQTINPGIKGQQVKLYIPSNNLKTNTIIRRKK